ncbi:MAG: signal peptide peptidase SppA [Candidatus Kapaibacteriales bacterium]
MADQYDLKMQAPPLHPNYPRRSRWWVPFLIVSVIIISLLIIIAVILDSIAGAFQKETVKVKDNSVLLINFNRQYNEYKGESFNTLFDETQGTTFYDLLRGIEKAKTDPKIKGIYLHCSMSPFGWAKRREIVDVLTDFKKSGKFIYAFIETGNEADYYLALPADSIFLAREGTIEMNGFAVSALFLKDFFDKIGIEFYVQQYEDFKSAGETFSRTKFSDSARLVYRSIIEQTYDNFIEKVAEYRQILKEKISDLLRRGVYSADSLFEYKLVDALLNDNQVKELIRKRLFGEKYNPDSLKPKVNFIPISSYVESEEFRANENVDRNNAVAIVYASGPIIQRVQKNPFQFDLVIEPSEFIKNLKKAREDKKVKAIIIRIDSPGGSVIASDEIWEEIRRTKKVKPVYASMSDLAASGGYYIAMACDTIIAHPATLTGSIGVILMFPNFSRLIGKIGVNVDTIATNEAANDLNLFLPFTKRQKDKAAELSKPVYYRFVSKVAESRKMSFEQTRSVAKGRVWLGSDAYERRLVDVLGGLNDAIKLASRRIGVPNPMIKHFPRPIDGFQLILKLLTHREDGEEKIQSILKPFVSKSSNQFSILLDFFPEQIRYQAINILQVFLNSKKENTLAVLPYILTIE